MSLVGLLLVCALAGASPALAAGARWELSSRAAPTNLAPGGEGLINVAAENLGDEPVSGATSEITITDALPSGLKVEDPSSIKPRLARGQLPEAIKETWKCSAVEQRLLSCSTTVTVPIYERIEVEIPVVVDESPGTVMSLTNNLSVRGGQTPDGDPAPGASLSREMRVSDAPVSFGVEEGGFAIRTENADGSPDTQAGSHPYQLTSTVFLNQVLVELQRPGEPKKLAPGAPALPKNLTFNLPPGLTGNVTAAGQCSDADFSSLASTPFAGVRNFCPQSSAIGVVTVELNAPSPIGYKTLVVPLFNLEPARGEPARFGFEAEAVPIVIDTSLRTGGDYGVTATVTNATAAAQVLGTQVVFWGQPSARVHDSSRGWACLRGGFAAFEGETCAPPSPRPTAPFLIAPTACDGPLGTSSTGLAWTGEQFESDYVFRDQLGEPLAGLEGCAQLPFVPRIDTQPQQEAGQATTSASTPTGLDVAVKLDQSGTLTEDALGDSDVKSATVTLPPGMTLSPSAANGLQACSEQQVGYEGPASIDPLSPGATSPLRFSKGKAECPDASKLASVRVKTPLLGEELSGWAYLAAQNANPFGSLVAIYIVAENEKLGLRVKLAGEGRLDEQTGQVTTTFADTPQVPFEELELQFFGGRRGALSTPPLCGAYATTSSFTSWAGQTRTPQAQPFQISSGVGGSPCPSNPLAFAPGFQAGSSNLQAGAFTPFTLSLDHPDGDQPLSAITMHLPSGIAAMLASVTPCPEPQAAENQCGSDSLIGHSVASSGLGGEPVTLPGSVYLTGPYKGAPFGLSVVTPAVAGPFDLGDVTVRSQILVDRSTAAVTILSDPFPTFVQGVPAQIKHITVTVDRPNFEFNPTNCNPTSITGTVSGAQGASVAVSSPFQVANCAALPFKPTLTAATKGNATKANGASFTVRVASSPGQANIAKTKLVLPIQLPARLTTLQKACLAATFEANPATCPEGSNIGTATVHTPVLRSPLSGPAYLVSHGNAAFPDVEFVLQGEGITLILDGQTDIKKGITTSSFNAVPDAPVSSFETTLPEGPHSVLTSNVPESKHFSLCGQKLTMPTTITGQNGVVIQQETKIPVEGCGAVKASKAKKLTRAQKLQKALKKCRRQFKHNKRKRATCEKQAHTRYGAKKLKKVKGRRSTFKG
ncbi:MAG TPA: hypothetical protein VHW67_03610 [Solirubrobacteraceae bacterium]|nr:hypothetical protein [Solirubrobacteraceae bacterium]